MGPKVIERHYYDKEADGPDHAFLIKRNELVIKSIREFEVMKGNGIKAPANSEKQINNRKSLVISEKLAKNTVLEAKHIEVKRPGYGIQPKDFENVLGRKLIKTLNQDTVLKWEHLN